MGANVSAPEVWNGSSDNVSSVSQGTDDIEPQHVQDKPIKILLLGAGGSGKSTFLKQLRVLKDEPFTSNDIETFRQLIFSNLIGGIGDLLNIVKENNIKVSYKVNCHFKAIQKSGIIDLGDEEPFPNFLREHFKGLWEDPSMQQAWKYVKNTALSENLPYFFSSIDRLFARSYVPNEQDIMCYNIRTTGISETRFNIRGCPTTVVDVGGQRSERKKWIFCFENVTCVVFSVNLNGYDQRLFEDNNTNEMEEALVLWDSIVSSRWFVNTIIILLLNKFDLFKKKVQTSDIREYFPDFKGPTKDAHAGYEYFERRFAKIALDGGRVDKKAVHIFATSAADTNRVRALMPAIEKFFLSCV